MVRASLPYGHLSVLGILTVVAFGSWFYGYGVLVEPIRQSTGWPESVLGTVYGSSLLVTGIGGTLAGRVLDRRGSRLVFAVSGALGAAGLMLASVAGSSLVFAVAGIVGGGATGAGGYYNATQSVAARLRPQQRPRVITIITLWGAFASPVFLPLVGWLVTAFGWRPTLRVLATVVGAAFLLAAVLLPDVRPDAPSSVRFRESLRATWHDRTVRRLFMAGTLLSAATALVLLYQVPVMTTAGLALTTASGLAGARGLMQLAGRLPLPAVIARIGARAALWWSYLLTGAGALLLLGSGSLVVAVLFVIVAGVGIGALSAVEGIYTAEVVSDGELATSLGVFSLLRGIGAASGPVIGSVLTDLAGSRAWALLFAGGLALLAAILVPPFSSSRGEGAASGERSPSARPAGT